MDQVKQPDHQVTLAALHPKELRLHDAGARIVHCLQRLVMLSKPNCKVSVKQ